MEFNSTHFLIDAELPWDDLSVGLYVNGTVLFREVCLKLQRPF